MVFRKNVDPVSLLDLGELKQVFARANHFMPKQRPGEYEFQYKKRLAQVNPSVKTSALWAITRIYLSRKVSTLFTIFFLLLAGGVGGTLGKTLIRNIIC